MTTYNDESFSDTDHATIYPVYGLMCDDTDHFCDCEHYYCDGSVVHLPVDYGISVGLSASQGPVLFTITGEQVSLSAGTEYDDITYD